MADIGYGPDEIAEIAMSLPPETHLHISGRGARGPWFIRAFIEGREVTKFDRQSGGFPDLGHGIEYVLALVRGASVGS